MGPSIPGLHRLRILRPQARLLRQAEDRVATTATTLHIEEPPCWPACRADPVAIAHRSFGFHDDPPALRSLDCGLISRSPQSLDAVASRSVTRSRPESRHRRGYVQPVGTLMTPCRSIQSSPYITIDALGSFRNRSERTRDLPGKISER